MSLFDSPEIGGLVSRVIVVGVHHFLQNLESFVVSTAGKESEARQKAAFKNRLEELILLHRPLLIGEEEKPGVGSIGKQLADTLGIKYCSLTMPWEERFKVGISGNYNDALETRRAAYEVFESFMFGQVQKNRGDVTSILVIRGSYHVERLAGLFVKAGDEVQWEDTYDAIWYVGRPIEINGQLVGHDKERPPV
jgi:hypothetical protein